MHSWEEDSDCCSWDGVTCDTETGHVIGLDLSCGWLHGNIPSNTTLFLLPQLQTLNLAFNNFNHSHISPGFSFFPRLTYLNLSFSNFSGQLPFEISHLSKLVSLDLSQNFQVSIDTPVLEGLVQNLTKLEELSLDYIDMSLTIVGRLTNLSSSLTYLSLNDCGMQGNFPDIVFRLPNLQFISLRWNSNLTGIFPRVNWSNPLEFLDVSRTRFSGELSNSIGNLMSLRYLNLYNCNFVGSIPASVGNLTQLAFLDFSANHFIGEIPADILVNLTQAFHLSIQNNLLVGPIPSRANRLPNLSWFSFFGNFLNGSIPSWIFNLPNVEYIDLGYNQLTGHLVEFQSNLLSSLYLDHNRFCGSIPILPYPLRFFLISNNKLTGKIPRSICNMSLFRVFDLYNNSLSGAIPECMGNFSNELQVLDLQKNRIDGRIPDTFARGGQLRTLSVNDNQLEGSIPRSLMNCKMLEVLDLGNNHLNDSFPNWLESLPNLRILILRSNKFHGFVRELSTVFQSFAKLRILDLSNNNFSGSLPKKYFENLEAMMDVNETERKLRYMSEGYYLDSAIVTLKGSDVEIMKIITTFTCIDFSNNNFHGEIPELIANLHALRLLNLSHNRLSGCIPSSLGNLTGLESLDLSSNKLVGEIPYQLTKLNFLQVLNLSQNQLTGPIPLANHFDTFPISSYSGNKGLCGFPMPTKCDTDSPPPFSMWEDTEPTDGFGWEVVLIGYGCGMVFGMLIGYVVFSTGKPKWLAKIVEVEHHRKLGRA
ncbi:receptor-like protein Cf-9 homolog [Pistacia vera]|uniref:receptor-like protein Cf-9 homolog n=1 Tax=Pistacia vera TaxID=55513 RepID=UPI0012636823|nr:receptor-like protein Cf-9 homolog [Pistacia vera]